MKQYPGQFSFDFVCKKIYYLRLKIVYQSHDIWYKQEGAHATKLLNFSGEISSSTEKQTEVESEVREKTLIISDGGDDRIICLDKLTH